MKRVDRIYKITKMEIDELTEQVIGRAHEVDNELGAGFREKIYANALKIEMKKARSKSGSSLGTARWVVERTFAWLPPVPATSYAL